MIQLQQVSIHLGDFSLNNVNLHVDQGQYAVLMGRTGQGKTTILEAICGLRRAKSGKIVVGEIDVTTATPADRCIGYVPQDLALFPTFTVYEHLAFALRLRRLNAENVDSRTREVARSLSIEHLLERRPDGLSGGEAQRVALGRALSFRPKVLLLDEPLSALDEETREGMVSVLRKIKQARDVTILHVTHNRQEATAVADSILQLSDLVTL